MLKIILSGALAIALVSAVGCSDAENVISCHDVCSRYKDCFDDDYDVSSCTNRCQADASDSDSRQSRLNSCNSCIDDKSCAGAAFGCATQCSGIVP
jgi:hypothetical protein